MSKLTKEQEQKFLQITAATLFVMFGFTVGSMLNTTATQNSQASTANVADTLAEGEFTSSGSSSSLGFGALSIPASPPSGSYSATLVPVCWVGRSTFALSWSRANAPISHGALAGSYYFLLLREKDSPANYFYYEPIKSQTTMGHNAQYTVQKNTYKYWGNGESEAVLRGLIPGAQYEYNVMWPGDGKQTGWKVFNATTCPQAPEIVSSCTQDTNAPSASIKWSPKATKAHKGGYYWILVTDEVIYQNKNYWFKAITDRDDQDISKEELLSDFKYFDGNSVTDKELNLNDLSKYYVMTVYPGDLKSTDWTEFTATACNKTIQ